MEQIESPVPFGRRHLILQFNTLPSAQTIALLKARGISVLQDIPENGLLVALDRTVSVARMGVRYAAPLDPHDKISPLIARVSSLGPAASDQYLLAEFFPDIDLNDARSLISRLGLVMSDNPDLGPRQLLIHTEPARMNAVAALLSAQDQVSYVFPASAELASGTPVRACAGPITINGAVGQYVPTFGYGWDGPGLNAATIQYVFSRMTSQLPVGSAEAEIQRAMAEWAKVAKIVWLPGWNSNGSRTVNILFARGPHGDGYPFDGPGGALAHTFYPAPPNPEPLAGDMHLDDDETWRIGANTDLFSVALHELGHALGLGHSDNPNDVMYPYYKMASTLGAGDKAAVLTMYAAQDQTVAAPPAPAPNPSPAPRPAPTPSPNPQPPSGGTRGAKDTTPPTLAILSPGGTTVWTSAPTLTFSGTSSDNTGVARITWSTNTGAMGTAAGTTHWTATVPVLRGSNTVIIRAFDAAGNMAWRSVVVSRY